jgi:hypothetical protein
MEIAKNWYHKYSAKESAFKQAVSALLRIGCESDTLYQMVREECQRMEEARIKYCTWFRNLDFLAYVAAHPGLSQGEHTKQLGMASCHITKRIKKAGDKLRRKGRGTKNDPYRYFVQEKAA